MIPGIFAGRPLSPPPPVGQTAFYDGDLITTTGWEPVSWPGAVYDATTDKTYVAWQFVGASGNKGIHVAAYDHFTGAWSRPFTAGTFALANDDHGHPALVIDAEGYIHCFFGSHSNDERWSVTESPGDISSWAVMPAISGSYTYPRPVLAGGDIYLLLRSTIQASSRYPLVVRKLSPVGGSGVWGAAQALVDFGANSRTYSTEAHAVGDEIHFCCTFATGADTARRGIYYFVYDSSTGGISNFDGSKTILSGSLPVDLADADADFRIYDHGSNDGDVASLQFDTNGNPHVLFADGTTPTYDLKHMMLDGGIWTSPVTIGSISDHAPSVGYVDVYCLAPGASGAMEAWYNVAGDRVRRVRTSGGSWLDEEIIATAGSHQFGRGTAVQNPKAPFRTMMAEISGSPNDSTAALIDLYAHGDGGFVSASIPDSDDPLWGDVTLLVLPSPVGVNSAVDASKSCLPVSLVGSAQPNADSPFVGGTSIRTQSAGYFRIQQNDAISTAGTDDFCIDVWFKINVIDGRIQAIASTRTSGFSLIVNADSKLQFLMWGASDSLALNIVGTDDVEAGEWLLASAERVDGETSLYLHGVLQGSAVQSITPTRGQSAVHFGRDPQVSNRHLDGWICEPRFTRAVRHGGAFTPPSGPWPR